MNVKVVVVILLISAMPVCAPAQTASVPTVSKDDAQKVVTIISGDKAKTQAYCDMQKLALRIEEAHKKKDGKTIRELSQRIETLEKTSVPNFSH